MENVVFAMNELEDLKVSVVTAFLPVISICYRTEFLRLMEKISRCNGVVHW